MATGQGHVFCPCSELQERRVFNVAGNIVRALLKIAEPHRCEVQHAVAQRVWKTIVDCFFLDTVLDFKVI